MTFPTDAELYYAVIEQCQKIARDNNIKLHQSLKFLAKEKCLKLRFAHHPKKKKEACHALKKHEVLKKNNLTIKKTIE